MGLAGAEGTTLGEKNRGLDNQTGRRGKGGIKRGRCKLEGHKLSDSIDPLRAAAVEDSCDWPLLGALVALSPNFQDRKRRQLFLCAEDI